MQAPGCSNPGRLQGLHLRLPFLPSPRVARHARDADADKGHAGRLRVLKLLPGCRAGDVWHLIAARDVRVRGMRDDRVARTVAIPARAENTTTWDARCVRTIANVAKAA